MQGDADAVGGRQGLPALNGWLAAVISFVFCYCSTAAMIVGRATLNAGTASWLEAVLSLALVFGVLAFLFPVLPLQLLIMLILRCWKHRHWAATWLMLLPGAYISAHHLYSAVQWRMPEHEKEVFEQTVGVSWPEGVKLVMAKHGFGLQDRRHLWLFEGTPAQFDKMVADRGWLPHKEVTAEKLSDARFCQIAKERFSKDEPWEPAEWYSWWADPEEDEPEVLGGGPLIPDKDHRRWYVGWDG